jgi:hypothetical protein
MGEAATRTQMELNMSLNGRSARRRRKRHADESSIWLRLVHSGSWTSRKYFLEAVVDCRRGGSTFGTPEEARNFCSKAASRTVHHFTRVSHCAKNPR